MFTMNKGKVIPVSKKTFSKELDKNGPQLLNTQTCYIWGTDPTCHKNSFVLKIKKIFTQIIW